VAEAVLGRAFGPAWNPLLNLGALGFFFYWIIAASGIYVYIFFDTGVHAAYASVEYMTHDQWYAAGVMRSLHRYASDALVAVVLVHVVREFGHDRYRGVRWFSWVTGLPVLVMIFIAGITGYWLVWDKLAQYVAIVSTEWVDQLGIFGQPVARNFLSVETLDSRFFSLMIFIHIAVPLIALVVLWIHLQRVTKPRINPPRGLAIGSLGAMLALSFIHPAVSQGPADLAMVPGAVGLDWFYLALYPLLETWPGPVTWSAAATLLVILFAVPWLPPLRRARPAVVDLGNCNGCERCYKDCPYNAITMVPRTDGLAFEQQASVDSSLCVSCGICAGACPTATPFRRMSDLVPGIDLPDLSIAEVRRAVKKAAVGLSGDARILVFGCAHGVSLEKVAGPGTGVVELACIGQLPPAFIDYVLSRKLADGVMLTGCTDNGCHARFGIRWSEERLAGARDPQLRARVPRRRLATMWAGRLGVGNLKAALAAFGARLAEPEPQDQAALQAERGARDRESADA
jgi:ferredoxin/coenzyme F420-reducing hydrogenase delta subunit